MEIVMPLLTPLVNFHVYLFLFLKSSLCVTQKAVTNHAPELLTTKGNPPLSLPVLAVAPEKMLMDWGYKKI